MVKKASTGSSDLNQVGYGGVQQIKRMAEISTLSPAELEDKKIIHSSTANKEFINTFRELRTKLIQSSSKKNFVAMVSSLAHGGGGTFVCVNLAAAFALDQSKTSLIVDCNLQDSAIEDLFGLDPEYGLTDYLEDPTLNVDDIIYASGIKRLRIIPAGSYREAGAEYFSSERMALFMDALKARYPDRFIFIDSPPAGMHAEGRIVSELSDYAVLVVPYGKVTHEQIQTGIDAVGKDKIAGLVFNN